MAKTSEITEHELAAWRGLQAMHRHLEGALEARLQADAGISNADFQVLSALSDVEDGALRNGDLAVLMGWEKSRLSHQVSRMEARGLVERVECDTDLRGTWVRLTEPGREAVRSALPDRTEALRTLLFDLLSDDERQILRQVSERVLGAMNAPACEVADRVMGVRAR